MLRSGVYSNSFAFRTGRAAAEHFPKDYVTGEKNYSWYTGYDLLNGEYAGAEELPQFPSGKPSRSTKELYTVEADSRRGQDVKMLLAEPDQQVRDCHCLAARIASPGP